ncbi:hypothetical protein [Puia dinghuensis]|uniref:Porin n=1 Tax=Puia dinghuensis TaxID=1792502 RepID=A0A8J2XTZ8_9BACT|nr:hypothetical protein [Puia dinghuensis]GGB07526.1 hypothetical protein GCM10011511_33780 [Puia dinghuensis]
MKRNAKQLLFIVVFFFLTIASQAQVFVNNDSAFSAGTPKAGRLWGYTFGDYYYKSHSDSLNRGGTNQYTGIPQSRNQLAFRRIYLGYDYNFNKKFSAELLLAAEDNFPAGNPPGTTTTGNSGDLLGNGKETFFIKLMNVKVKNIWKGTDLVVGEQFTPSFAMLTEKVWNYRSIERTVSDIRRTPSYDLGIGLNGVFDPATKNFGYNVLMANGTSDKPATNSFKWWYGDIWGMFANKHLIIDLYTDYQRLNWQPGWHHDRQMFKAFAAWSSQPITIGVEGFINNMAADTKASKIGGGADTIATNSTGLAFFAHGDIVTNKLRWFARVDLYNPNTNIDNTKYTTYGGLNSPSGYLSTGYHMTYSPSTGAPTTATATTDNTAKETFFTAGLDFMPYKDIHFEPNVWLVHYSSQQAAGTSADQDVVFRLTFFFVFGKNYKNNYTQL